MHFCFPSFVGEVQRGTLLWKGVFADVSLHFVLCLGTCLRKRRHGNFSRRHWQPRAFLQSCILQPPVHAKGPRLRAHSVKTTLLSAALLLISRRPSSEAQPSEADDGHDQEQGKSGVEAGSGRQARRRGCSGVPGISTTSYGAGSWYHASVCFDWFRLCSRSHINLERAIDDHMVLVAIRVWAYKNRAVQDKGCSFTPAIVPSSFLGRTFVAYAAAVPFPALHSKRLGVFVVYLESWDTSWVCVVRRKSPPLTNNQPPHEWPPMCGHPPCAAPRKVSAKHARPKQEQEHDDICTRVQHALEEVLPQHGLTAKDLRLTIFVQVPAGLWVGRRIASPGYRCCEGLDQAFRAVRKLKLARGNLETLTKDALFRHPPEVLCMCKSGNGLSSYRPPLDMRETGFVCPEDVSAWVLFTPWMAITGVRALKK